MNRGPCVNIILLVLLESLQMDLGFALQKIWITLHLAPECLGILNLRLDGLKWPSHCAAILSFSFISF